GAGLSWEVVGKVIGSRGGAGLSWEVVGKVIGSRGGSSKRGREKDIFGSLTQLVPGFVKD
nr:hypothetical protein [Tanacetum cinerariifolium]